VKTSAEIENNYGFYTKINENNLSNLTITRTRCSFYDKKWFYWIEKAEFLYG
jgi:hypothetical protein